MLSVTLVPLLVRAVLPVTATAPVSVPEMVGQVKVEDALDTDLVRVWCPLTALAWPARPNPPDAATCDDLGMRAAMAVTAGAGPAAAGWTDAGAVCRTRIETVENKRKTIAPAETAMTGTVLPAGCERKTAPVCPTLVLIRSASSASPSWGAGSGGQ